MSEITYKIFQSIDFFSTYINKYNSQIKKGLLGLSLVSLIVFFSPVETYKNFGEYAWYFLILTMVIRPLNDIFYTFPLFRILMKFRQEFGILAGVFGLAHVFGYFGLFEYDFHSIFSNPLLFDYSKYLFWGVLASLVSLPLLLTSNSFFPPKLGKYWKIIQRLSYFMFVFVALHIFLIEKEIGPLLIVVVWLGLFIYARISLSKRAQKSQYDQWLCVPCGYIYDPEIGDVDSGILPGTRFEDIPDDRRCPVCGVGKQDFVKISGKTNPKAQIVSIDFLTKNVFRISLTFADTIKYISGQFITFEFEDEIGIFYRSYSILSDNGNTLDFIIKIKEDGRAGKIFRTFKTGDSWGRVDIGGAFVLQDTTHPKVFLASGTGIVPIYAMAQQIPGMSKKLYMTVSYFEDVFFLEELKQIPNLDLKYHITRENKDGFESGRINISQEIFDTNTEFYVCGNPSFVSDMQQTLQNRGYEKVFVENFG